MNLKNEYGFSGPPCICIIMYLLILFNAFNFLLQENLDLNIFKEMEGLSWHYVSMNDIETLLDLAYSRLDPFLIVSNWNSGCEFHVLQ